MIIGVTLTYIAWQAGFPEGVVVGVALSGALLGFLIFNFPPASIFLGDTGALFIGYCLSLLALEGYQKVTVLTFIVPLLALAVPIMDTLLSILRRRAAPRQPALRGSPPHAPPAARHGGQRPLGGALDLLPDHLLLRDRGLLHAPRGLRRHRSSSPPWCCSRCACCAISASSIPARACRRWRGRRPRPSPPVPPGSPDEPAFRPRHGHHRPGRLLPGRAAAREGLRGARHGAPLEHRELRADRAPHGPGDAPPGGSPRPELARSTCCAPRGRRSSTTSPPSPSCRPPGRSRR